jgi:hypothetical protein
MLPEEPLQHKRFADRIERTIVSKSWFQNKILKNKGQYQQRKESDQRLQKTGHVVPNASRRATGSEGFG